MRLRHFVACVGISSAIAGSAESPATEAAVPDIQAAATQAGRQWLGDKQNAVRAMACGAAVPPGFALAVLDKESGFDNNMRGSRGEIGASQILPSTAVALGFDLQRLAREFSYNARAGVSILRGLLSQSRGNRRKALCAYRAGPGWPGLAPRFQSYVRAYVAEVEQLMQTRYTGVSCQ